MDTHGSCKLGETADGELNLFACSHNKVGKLIDNQHYIRQVPMPVVGVELTTDEFRIVLLKVAHLGRLEQVIALVHLYAERVEGAYHLLDISNDSLFRVRQLGQIMTLYGVIE